MSPAGGPSSRSLELLQSEHLSGDEAGEALGAEASGEAPAAQQQGIAPQG